MGQDGGAPVLRPSEPERAARGGASRAARVPGQVRGKQGEGREAAAPPSPFLLRPGLLRSPPVHGAPRGFMGVQAATTRQEGRHPRPEVGAASRLFGDNGIRHRAIA